MKTSQGFMTALLTLVALTFLSSSFAQETSPQFVVRIIYFIPNDREPRQNMDTHLVGLIQLAQEHFADLMESQGFSRKTFQIESDATGNVVVHYVRGRFNDAYYQNPSSGSWIVWEEIEEQFDTSSNIYLLVLDISSECLIQAGGAGAAGLGTGNSLSGRALVTASDTDIALHELEHAFGLQHDERSDTDFCFAEWLDVHRYFNTSQNAFNEDTSVQMLTPSLGVPPYGIHIRFEVTDADGLHQAQLFKPFGGYPSVIACKKLNGKNTTVEFVTTELIGGHDIVLRVMDVHGNFTEHSFPIDVTPLLPPPEVISIPDPNLAALVRETVGLARLDPITQLAMLNLDNFHADGRQIENLAGIEYATNMYWLVLLENQIRDITSLAALTKLRVLFIVRNSISDISPLTGLMNLGRLFVWENPLSYASIYTHIPALQARGVEVFFDNRTPQRIRIVSGNDQQGLPGAALKEPFVVAVRDGHGVAFEGVPVTFAVTSGGGTLSTTSTATNTNGRAESILMLGPNPGINTVTVSVAGIPEGQTFNAVDIRVPKTLEIISGDDQEGLPGAALDKPFGVEVRDGTDKPLPGVEVTFSVTGGGGTLSVTSATTDKNGRAESILILGSNAGTNSVTVSVTGIARTETFNSEGIRTPKTLEIFSGGDQEGAPGAALENPFVVEVRDQSGDPLPGVQVTFSVSSGGGTLSATSVMTDVNGRAESILTLGPNLGRNTVTVSVTGIQEQQTFTAEGIRIPLAFWIISGDKQQGLLGEALANPFVVEVRDQSGDPLPGVQVAFSVSIGGGMLSATSATTDVNGRAESILTLGPNPGANTVEVGVTGIQEKQSVSAIAELPPIAQDVNRDDVVNILDLVLVASVLGDEGRDLDADVNRDGVVNILDLVLVAGAFGNAAAAPSAWYRDRALEMLQGRTWDSGWHKRVGLS